MASKFGNLCYATFLNKCPRCHQGNMFETNNPYNFKSGFLMNKRCKVCNENLEPEPGFYFGAMYVSYGLTVGFGFILYLILIFLGLSLATSVIISSLALCMLIPMFFRYSRIIWLGLFVSYREKEGPTKP